MKLARTLGLFLVAGVSAFATSVTFTFDTQTINGTVVTGLSSGANSAAIQTYMQNVLNAAGCTGCTVTVYTGGSSGAVADQTYNGEGHVTGPGTPATKSLTLGDSNGATQSNTTSTVNSTYDTFIANTNDSSGQVSQQITVQFHGIAGLTITSFDYEIFPDGTCSALTSGSCGGAPSNGIYPNQPDLEFAAGNSTNGTVGAGGDTIQQTYYGITPGSGSDGNTNNSPLSNSEAAPQLIGTWSGSLTGATELDFVDWPATIGIDNLAISYNTTNPEPASLILLGTLVGGLLLKKKLKAS
jgi:hypothetical protein